MKKCFHPNQQSWMQCMGGNKLNEGNEPIGHGKWSWIGQRRQRNFHAFHEERNAFHKAGKEVVKPTQKPVSTSRIKNREREKRQLMPRV